MLAGMLAHAVVVAGCSAVGEADVPPEEPLAQALPLGAAAREPLALRLERAYAELEARQLSVLVAVSHRSEPPLVRAFGAPATDGIDDARTQVDLGSITKTVTAVMVAKLVEQRKLRFDTRLADIFPDVPRDKARISVHQLLTHAAGLPEQIGDDHEPIDRATFLARAFAARLLAPPGRAYRYSNVGYGILAAVIEARSGKSYEAYLRDDVLGTSGLSGIGYRSAYDDARSLESTDEERIREVSWGGDAPSWNLIGNGGLVSTLPDFVRFRQAVAQGKVVPLALVRQLQTPHISEGEGESFYGYGLVVQCVEGIGRIYQHDGGNDVFSAHWVEYIDEGDLVVTAGVDQGDLPAAVEAMSVMAAALYGFEQPSYESGETGSPAL